MQIVHELLYVGETPLLDRGSSYKPRTATDSACVFINPSDLARWAKERGILDQSKRGIAISLGRLLKKLAVRTERPIVERKQVRGVWLPPLPEARRRWSEITGRTFDWGEGDDAGWDIVPDVV
jgi:hypothetical protein